VVHLSEIARKCAHFERDFSSRRGFVGFERTRISPICDACLRFSSGQAESEITWCGLCFKLAQASWVSLGEAESLVWAMGS